MRYDGCAALKKEQAMTARLVATVEICIDEGGYVSAVFQPALGRPPRTHDRGYSFLLDFTRGVATGVSSLSEYKNDPVLNISIGSGRTLRVIIQEEMQ